MKTSPWFRQRGRATPAPAEVSTTLWWILLLAAGAIGLSAWERHQYRSEVSHESVGRVLAVKPGGGWVTGWIQTETGDFPIRESVQVMPGTPLDLVTTANDRRKLCTLDRRVCVGTTAKVLGG